MLCRMMRSLQQAFAGLFSKAPFQKCGRAMSDMAGTGAYSPVLYHTWSACQFCAAPGAQPIWAIGSESNSSTNSSVEVWAMKPHEKHFSKPVHLKPEFVTITWLKGWLPHSFVWACSANMASVITNAWGALVILSHSSLISHSIWRREWFEASFLGLSLFNIIFIEYHY